MKPNITNEIASNPTTAPNQSAIALPPSPQLPAPLPPTPLMLPHWLLAIFLLTVLAERLGQLLPIAIEFLEKIRELRKK